MSSVDIPLPTDDEWEADRKRLFDEFKEAHLADGSLFIDQQDGIRETLHYDDSEQKFHLQRVEDVEPVLEWCTGRFNEGLANSRSEFRHVGRYPITVANIFAKKWGFPDWATALKDKQMVYRLLNDSDLSKFRTLGGAYDRRGE